MNVEDTIIIPEEIKKHNELARLIESEGEFRLPKSNKVTNFRVGHIHVINPKPNHPDSYGRTIGEAPLWAHNSGLPVGYMHYGQFWLVNTDKPVLREYHTKLRSIVEGWLTQI